MLLIDFAHANVIMCILKRMFRNILMATLKELYIANLFERWRNQLETLTDDQLNRLVIKIVEWFLYTAANDMSNEISKVLLGTRRGKINFLLSGDPFQPKGGMVDFLARLYDSQKWK
jgi:hypothetical protein